MRLHQCHRVQRTSVRGTGCTSTCAPRASCNDVCELPNQRKLMKSNLAECKLVVRVADPCLRCSGGALMTIKIIAACTRSCASSTWTALRGEGSSLVARGARTLVDADGCTARHALLQLCLPGTNGIRVRARALRAVHAPVGKKPHLEASRPPLQHLGAHRVRRISEASRPIPHEIQCRISGCGFLKLKFLKEMQAEMPHEPAPCTLTARVRLRPRGKNNFKGGGGFMIMFVCAPGAPRCNVVTHHDYVSRTVRCVAQACCVRGGAPRSLPRHVE